MEQDISKIEAAIEGILFSLGDVVPVDKIAQALGHDNDTIYKIIKNMMDKYDSPDRGIRIIEINNGFQLCTKMEYYEQLSKIVNIPKKHVLTDVLLETLSIIAYKQPITRQEIEAIRGVSCVHAVNRLMEYNLVCELGRLDAVGKPILFGTTDDFLRSFGVSSIDDLPVINQAKIETFKQEAVDEIQISFQV